MNNKPNHKAKCPRPGALMARVAAAIQERGLSLKGAAEAINVTLPTLQKHLAGEHVRSDSARKYENWLDGRAIDENVFVLTPKAAEEEVSEVIEPAEGLLAAAPRVPRLVVDIFSGCGGLSLGFDLLASGTHFKTILAIDNQAAPIAVLNRNAELLGHHGRPVGRQMDLTEFMNEAEFLAFYIEHVAALRGDARTASRLHELADGAFPAFLSAIAATDSVYMSELTSARIAKSWRAALEKLDRQSLGQTSVIGFHDKLRLPRTSIKTPSMPIVLWHDASATVTTEAHEPDPALLSEAEWEWDAEVATLSARQEASGRGQLSASARRVSAFVGLLHSKAMQPMRNAWTRWRARRLKLQANLFGNPEFAAQLRKLYSSTYPVNVLVGGPPCQGFSRIGRGKIRSLREALVHVQGHSRAGDARNLLFQQYVMVLGALRPELFLFENVQHFQSTVKADGMEFQATEVLAEAIANVSSGEVSYEVSSRIIDASRHGVPQARQRYFMCGVKKRINSVSSVTDAENCLSLQRLAEVPLSYALAGLPHPELVGGDTGGSSGMEGLISVAWAPEASAPHPYVRWIQQNLPGREASTREVDAHIARTARADDTAFFALMGPGKRWMDYRADNAPTIEALGELLDALTSLPKATLNVLKKAAVTAGREFPDLEELELLRRRVDGSLPLRLLLEQAGEKLGAPHHLLTETYLAKRDGHHGDWVARMDASRPAKTLVSHMGKDTYGYIHPTVPRTISVREAARIQSFPDWFSFGGVALTDALKMIGNAVPPLLSHAVAARVTNVLSHRTGHTTKIELLARPPRRATSS